MISLVAQLALWIWFFGCIFRARFTVRLSASLSSSMPRMAMMSWSSRYFCRTVCTPRAMR